MDSQESGRQKRGTEMGKKEQEQEKTTPEHQTHTEKNPEKNRWKKKRERPQSIMSSKFANKMEIRE